MRIDSSGNVGIGTLSDSLNNKLTIKESSNSTDSQFIHLKQTGADHGFKLGIDSSVTGDMFIKSRTSGSDSSNLLGISKSGDVTVSTGNLVIGTSGKGIDFSAVSDGSRSVSSNVLDDYEEGTFTPVLTGSTSGTFNGTGHYTKIGNTISIHIGFNNIGAGLVGNISITGLPFTSSSSINRRPLATFVNYATIHCIANIASGSSTLNISKIVDSNYDATPITGSQFNAYADLYISGCYID